MVRGRPGGPRQVLASRPSWPGASVRAPARHTGGVAVVAEFEAQRQQLFGLAYRLLGAAGEAEAIIQEALVRWSRTDRAEVTHPEAWQMKIVTDLCVSRLGAARSSRERHPGSWLPEPVPTGALGRLDTAEQRASASLALLTLLERRTPRERAVFVLREAFGYRYREIADVLELSPGNCRQLYHRAARQLTGRRPVVQPDRAQRVRLAEQFVAATCREDPLGLEEVLAEEVTVCADGVSGATIPRHPVAGRGRVVRYLIGGFRKIASPVEFGVAEINASTAIVAKVEGLLLAVVAMEIENGRIASLLIVADPGKLSFFTAQCRPNRAASTDCRE